MHYYSLIYSFTLFLMWALHDSLYTRIRNSKDQSSDRVYDLSLYAKVIKFFMLLGAIGLVCYTYASKDTVFIFHVTMEFVMMWFVLFDYTHGLFSGWGFMSPEEYIDRHFIHRIYQWFERRFK